MKKVLPLLLIAVSIAASAQKNISTLEQTWLGYISQMRVSQKWSLTADVHLRTQNNFFENRSVAVGRAGGIYHLNDDVNLGAGYAYFHYFPQDGHEHVDRPEHRFYQQVQWISRYPKLRLQNRLRLEERYRKKILNAYETGEGYNFNYRARLQAMMFYPLSKKGFATKSISLYAGEEILINFGKEIVFNTLDHNRLHIGLTYHVDNDDQLQVGYLNIFQQQSSGNKYRMVHVARIYYHHAIDFRKKKSA